ncbi:Suf-domain-containing protein [Aaosphaeria arxii CBS 175.79]|uniref:mRNA 3'-end-processing protein RNA14 n=1 Tax=Aaosphaeria arxii CBS 175.79 TaxID=1450172 RepID=A0A6A5XYV5_9PLEO|nr:Suf-domain-containing protein [Aaosphaeria arxii CBS 175.79]KAF2018362.1 Suf-domain-containing protein [Aaosphaeria arxii CBS 175.79]
MADMDPELAFLNAQKEYDPAGDYSLAEQAGEDANDDEEEEEEYDPSAGYEPYVATHEEEYQQESAESIPQSATNTPPAAAEDAQEQPPAVPAPAQVPTKQPRTIGGFVDESEDEDEVTEATGAALQNASAAGVSTISPQRSHTNTPSISNPSQTQNVPVHSAQAQGPFGASISTSVAVNDTAPHSAPVVPNGSTPIPDATKLQPARSATASVTPAPAAAAPLQKPARLPQDRVGQFEDRIAEDSRGDIEAWLSLIEEHRRRHKIDDARLVFDRFFQVFPSAADQWIEYVNMEQQQQENNQRVEALFNRSIANNPHVGLWATYVNYIRRVHNVTVDESKRAVIHQVYEFVLETVGIDISSGRLWLDYIEFIKSGPGTLGGQGWQDMQKMDMLRKIYQRAVAVPTNATLEIWREYDKFEMSFNKATGRKNMQENSQLYMNARSANNVLEGLIKGVDRATLPKLPPAKGFDGHDAYMNQVTLWKAWIEWEKNDPLYLKDTNQATYNKRVLYLYKQALMALRFWPQLWFDAAEWAYDNDLTEDGDNFLTQGMEANPESCLLAFRKAHQIELKGEFDDDKENVRKGEAVREPFNKVLDALYDLTNKMKKREEHALTRAKETHAAQMAAEDAARAHGNRDSDYDSDDDEAEQAAKVERRQNAKAEILQSQLQAISAGYNAQIQTLRKTLSFAWIALMRTMRRIQGKGQPNPPAGMGPGFRGIFAEARKKGKLVSDTYIASALIEHHCYQDAAATKIFDRGMKLFPDDEQFALEYIKHLVRQNDATNARSVFEILVNRLVQKDGGAARTKPLFLYFHKYESSYGELAQIVKLEKRMHDLFPEDPRLVRFAQRFSTEAEPSAPSFDPTAVLPIISWKTQMKPVMINIIPTIEQPPSPVPAPPVPQIQDAQPAPVINSPRIAEAFLPVTNSPKRSFDEVDNDVAQPRKMMRGESPLKGAAGRRLDAARRSNLARASEGMSNTPAAAQPTSIPREINFLLSIIPGAQSYHATRFNPEKLAGLLRVTDVSRDKRQQQQAPTPMSMPVQTPTPVNAYAPPPMNMAWGAPPSNMGGYYGR